MEKEKEVLLLERALINQIANNNPRPSIDQRVVVILLFCLVALLLFIFIRVIMYYTINRQ